MSLRYFVHILFKRKWLILTAIVAAPLIAGAILIFAEPVYVSHCKLEIHDRTSGNDPLGPTKSTIKDDVFITTQIGLIFTDQVMDKVIDKAGLLPTPPSQSIYARYRNITPPPSKLSPERERIELIRALKSANHVKADAANSVVLDITAQMNTPELAQKVAQAVLDSYKEEFTRMQRDNSQFEEFYRARLKALDSMINECQTEMENFNKQHPRDTASGRDPLLLVNPDQQGSPLSKTIPNLTPKPDFNPRMSEVTPVQLFMNEIARLEIELVDIQQHNSKESFKYKSVADKIEANKKLLHGYLQNLSEQEVLAVEYSGMKWKLESLHLTRQKVAEEHEKLLTTYIALSNASGTISVQDKPTFDPQPIFPKKALILAASLFIGLLLGLSMAYIAHVLDTTYHLPEDFSADTGVPVLASIPFAPRMAGASPARH